MKTKQELIEQLEEMYNEIEEEQEILLERLSIRYFRKNIKDDKNE